ncbi:MAG: hypothetical protein HUK26_02775 [Duodenibacillus sp.]|nr:hypothetical protein [Duodenibacillus sp.]
MDRSYYTELIAGNPECLKAVLLFNAGRAARAAAPAAPQNPAAAKVLARFPGLGRRGRPAAPRAGDDFLPLNEESQRLILLPAAELTRLGKLVAASAFGEPISTTIARDTVLELRAFLGQDIVHYAVRRGRFQVGGFARDLAQAAEAAAGGEATLAQRCGALARLSLEVVRAGWPEALQAAADPLFSALALPACPAALPGDKAFRRRLWHFMKKTMVRELDGKWVKYFA